MTRRVSKSIRAGAIYMRLLYFGDSDEERLCNQCNGDR